MRPRKVLISRERIADRIARMGEQITSDLRSGQPASAVAGDEQPVVMVPILTGSLVFLADLIRHVPVKMSIRPVTITSYPGKSTSSQGASFEGNVPTDLARAHVLIVDDILDSGRTLGLLRRVIAAQHPASLRIAVLLRKQKPSGRDEHVDVDYIGFDIEDEFVIGYGLDFDGYYRNLPDIAAMETE